MNKVININFQGRILPIEEAAYEILKQYIESLRIYFANEEGRDEIINDIECRVAELCEDKIKKGSVCITQEDIDLIIASIGRPADFEAQDGFEQTDSHAGHAGNGPSNSQDQNTWTSTHQKRLYRDEQNKVLGGVCSGIANYFNLDPLLVRILWIFLIGVNIFGYVILWIAVPSSSVKEVGGVRKRLFRDIDNKVIGGVAAGLSKYFGIQVWIVRALFLIPFIRFVFNFRHLHLFQFWDSPDFPNFLDFTFSPGAVFVYIVLWLVLPEAKTSADKLEMVGEKVDLNSIKNTIQNDMEGFGKRAQSWGSDFYKKNDKVNQNYASSGSEASGLNTEPVYTPPSERKGCFYFIGRVITISVKVFVYFVLGVILISLLAALFGIGVAGTSLLPLKGFILEDGLQSAAAIGTILFFVWVPVLAIVTAIIRKIAGFKRSNIWVRSSFIALWVFGWVCLFYFISSLGNSFSKHNIPTEQSVQISNSKMNYLELTAAPKLKYYENHWFQVTPFEGFYDEDTVFVRNLRIRIVQSKTDSFEIKLVKLSNGKTIKNANELAEKINFSLTQQDSIFYLDNGIAINKRDKFRNQHIIMTIAVPVGKRFKITNRGWSQTNIKMNGRGMHFGTIDRVSSDDNWYDEWNEPWDNESFDFDRGVEYMMTTSGLEKLKRDSDQNEYDDTDNPSHSENEDEISGMEKKLQELKKERERMNKKSESGTTTKSILAVPGGVGKFTDLQWVMDRFKY
jgi:phage shock protein PspC (stress-responsive transcriptional regulator)